MRKYLYIPENEWEKYGVNPWDREDPEDAGYRTCPACDGISLNLEAWCDTCQGTGEVQWCLHF